MAFLVSKRRSVSLSYYKEEENYLFAQVAPNSLYRGHISTYEKDRRGNSVNTGFHFDKTDRRQYRVIEAIAAAPKEVSLLFAFGDSKCREAVLAAHMSATDVVIRLIEEEFNLAKVTRSGLETKQAGLVEPLAFTHILSRSADPHLHSHILIPNSVLIEGEPYAFAFDALSYGTRYADIVYLSALKDQLQRPEIGEAISESMKIALLPNLREQYSKRRQEVEINDVYHTSRSRAIAQRSSRQPKGDLSSMAEILGSWRDDGQAAKTHSIGGGLGQILENAILNAYRGLEERALDSGIDRLFDAARIRTTKSVTNFDAVQNSLVSKLEVSSVDSSNRDPIARVWASNEVTIQSDLRSLSMRGWDIATVRSSRIDELLSLDDRLRLRSRSGSEVISISEDNLPSVGNVLRGTSKEYEILRGEDFKGRSVTLVASAIALPVLLDSIALDRAKAVELLIVDRGRYDGDRAIGRGASIRNEVLSGVELAEDLSATVVSPSQSLVINKGQGDDLGATGTSAGSQIVFHSSARTLVDRVVTEQAKLLECGGLIYPEQRDRSRVVVEDTQIRSLISQGIANNLEEKDPTSFLIRSSQFRRDNSQIMKDEYLTFCEKHPLRKEVAVPNCDEPVGYNAFGVMSKSEFQRTINEPQLHGEVDGELRSEVCTVIDSNREIHMRVEPLPMPQRVVRRPTFGERSIALLGGDVAVAASSGELVQGEQSPDRRIGVDIAEHLAMLTSPSRQKREMDDVSINRRIARVVDVDYISDVQDPSEHGRIVANVRALSRMVCDRREKLGFPIGIAPEEVSHFIEKGISYLDREEILELNRGSVNRSNAPRELLLELELGMSL